MAGPVVAGSPYSAPLDMNTRVRLSIMMFMQFAIWGGWAGLMGNYLGHFGFSEEQVATIGSMMPLGGMLGPVFLIFSRLADRLVPSQYLMAVFHFAAGGIMFWVATLQSPDHYRVLLAGMFAYALLYNMTLVLVNSITFANSDGPRDFPSIRVFGTLGWIAAGLFVDFVLSTAEDKAAGIVGIPAFQTNGFLRMTAILSIVLGGVSLALPHTPPAGKPGDVFPFIAAMRLFRDRSFAIFFIASFTICIAFAFHVVFTGQYLEKSHNFQQVAAIQVLGPGVEIGFMLALPFFLRKLGMKRVLLVGMFCWALRYALNAFSAGKPEYTWMAIIAILLHGICFDFFLAAGFIHVDRKAPPEIRASAQALYAFLTYGVGMFLGSLASGQLAKSLKTIPLPDGTKGVDWATFWWVPSIGVLVSMAIFAVAFREEKRPTAG